MVCVEQRHIKNSFYSLSFLLQLAYCLFWASQGQPVAQRNALASTWSEAPAVFCAQLLCHEMHGGSRLASETRRSTTEQHQPPLSHISMFIPPLPVQSAFATGCQQLQMPTSNNFHACDQCPLDYRTIIPEARPQQYMAIKGVNEALTARSFAVP